MGLVPLRVEAFYWRVVSSKVSTVDNLRRRGILLDDYFDICVLCGMERENIDHLSFIINEFTQFIWCRFLDKCGVYWCMPSTVAKVFEAWGIPFFGNGKMLWRMIPFAIACSLWMERNARIFRRSSTPKEDVARGAEAHSHVGFF